MTQEIVKIKKTSYGKYEELLLLREALKNEALIWNQEYNRAFGELIIAVFNEVDGRGQTSPSEDRGN